VDECAPLVEGPVEIRNTTLEVFRAILEYIYTDEVGARRSVPCVPCSTWLFAYTVLVLIVRS
jgi:hypothetical protein